VRQIWGITQALTALFTTPLWLVRYHRQRLGNQLPVHYTTTELQHDASFVQSAPPVSTV